MKLNRSTCWGKSKILRCLHLNMNQPHYNGSENQNKTSNTDEIFQKPNLLMGGTPSLGCPWPPALPGQDKDEDDRDDWNKIFSC